MSCFSLRYLWGGGCRFCMGSLGGSFDRWLGRRCLSWFLASLSLWRDRLFSFILRSRLTALRWLKVNHVGGCPIDLGQLISAEDTHLIQLKQFADGFRITSPRRIQKLPALIHLFFFGMRSSSPFHAHPFSTAAEDRAGPRPLNAPRPRKLLEYIRVLDSWEYQTLCLLTAHHALMDLPQSL